MEDWQRVRATSHVDSEKVRYNKWLLQQNKILAEQSRGWGKESKSVSSVERISESGKASKSNGKTGWSRDFGVPAGRGGKSGKVHVQHHRGGSVHVTPGRAFGSMPRLISTTPKTMFILVIYVMLVSSSAYAFQTTWAEFNEEDVASIFSGHVDGAVEVNIPFSDRAADIRNYEELVILFVEYIGSGDVEEEMDAYNALHGGEPRITGSQYGIVIIEWPDGHSMEISEYYEMFGTTPTDQGESLADQIWAFFGTITNGFGMIIGFLTLNFYPALVLPPAIQWLPFMLVLPVWIYVTLVAMPIAIDFIKAAANLLDAVLPFT